MEENASIGGKSLQPVSGSVAARGQRQPVSRPAAARSARDRLTAQQLQIAKLAAEGLSNREIGQRLYVFHRTISTHLYRIYHKLGITSRGELRRRLMLKEEPDDLRGRVRGT